MIARASSFRAGFELEDGWRAIADAEKLYMMIADRVSPEDRRAAEALKAQLEMERYAPPTGQQSVQQSDMYSRALQNYINRLGRKKP